MKSKKEKPVHDLDAKPEIKKRGVKKTPRKSPAQFLRTTYQQLIILLKRKKEERLTLMFIPHNEQKIKNFHISNLTLSIIIGLFTSVVVVSSVLIINHTSTLQEVKKLKISQEDAKIQFAKIREEIRSMDSSFGNIRTKISDLHALSLNKSKSDVASFGQGGPSIPLENISESNETGEKSEIPPEIFLLNRIIDDMERSEKPLQDIEKFLEKRSKIIKDTPTLWPVEGYVVNPYGMVRHADNLKAYFNSGIDISAPPGSEVVVSAPGLVSSITRDSKWGWIVKIRHNYGYETIYKGLDRVTIEVDKDISKGDTIGYLGNGQGVSGSILHYRIYIGVDAQDPMPYLSYIAE
ncbi:MAG: M23 family metallopeptidase [Leptospirales bacterium]